MNNLRRLLVTGMVVAVIIGLLPTFSQSVGAQGNPPNVIIDATFGKTPATFNAVFCDEAECAGAQANILPGLVGIDYDTGLYIKGQRGNVVKDWTVSEDGLTYTLIFRNDMKWSDGVPVTTKDVLYVYNAIKNPAVESPNASLLAEIADVKATDDYTLVVTLKQPSCQPFFQISNIIGTGGIMPSHVFPEDVTKLKDAEWNLKPTVSSGQYKFAELRTDEQTIYDADQSYPDKLAEKIAHDRYVVKVVPSQTVLVQQFLAGAIDLMAEPAVARRADFFKQKEEGKIGIYTAPGTLWDHIVLNLADPANPQDAFEKKDDGNIDPTKPVKQDPHPIFGDVKVRQAFALGIDMEAIIKGAVFGYGQPMASFLTPGNFAVDKDLKPYAYDPEKAAKLLEEAGWVDDDNNPETPRVAKGSKTAPDGTPLKFQLITIQGNVRRTAVGTVIKDQLAKIGFEVDFVTMDFGVMIDRLQAQTFDAVISARGSAYGDLIDWTFLFDPEGDTVKTGSNNGSYINPELTKIMKQAASLPGCDLTKRLELYKQAQKILHDEVPYIWLYAQDYMYAWNSRIGNVAPKLNAVTWNSDTWTAK